jgi:hypothetical protein
VLVEVVYHGDVCLKVRKARIELLPVDTCSLLIPPPTRSSIRIVCSYSCVTMWEGEGKGGAVEGERRLGETKV